MLLCACHLALCESLFTFSNDDPFINFRYADNVLAGRGPVMNAGERVEGFSSPLQLAWVILIRRTQLDPLIGVKLLGVLWSVSTILVLFAIGRALREAESWTNLGAPALFASNVWCALQAVNGLETSLTAFLLTLSLLLFLREETHEFEPSGSVRTGSWMRWGLSGAALGLAWLARPETPLIAAGAITCLVLFVRAGWGHGRGSLWVRRGVLLLAVSGPYLVFRWVYYGEVLPNTYYAKQLPLSQSCLLGISYVIPILAVNLGVLLLISLPVVLWTGTLRQRLVGAAALGAGIGTGVFVLRSGGDWMEGYRFLVPVLPAAFLVLQEGGEVLFRSRRPVRNEAMLEAADDSGTRSRWFDARSTPMLAIVTAVAILGLSHDLLSIRRDGLAQAWHRTGFAEDYRALMGRGSAALIFEASDRLGREAKPGCLVAIGEAGIIPFEHPELRFIDEHGLTDRNVARMACPRNRIGPEADYASTQSPVAAYILAQGPEIILRSTNRWNWEKAHVNFDGRYGLVWAKTRAEWGQPDVGFLLWRRAWSDAPRS